MPLLRAGKTNDEAVKLLDDISSGGLNDARNSIPHIGSPSFNQLMMSAVLNYERWTESAIRQLRRIFVDGPVIDRVRAEKYWLIVGSVPASPRTASMIHTELSELEGFFRDVANNLREQSGKCAQARWLVPDTNTFLHYYRLDDIPLKKIFGKEARVAVPHVVIDEIDSKSYNSGPGVQKRARGVYRMLEMLLDELEVNGTACLRDGTHFQVIADEPGSLRLPNNDDEIIAKASELRQAAYPSTVAVLTRDIGMRARALAHMVATARLPDKYLIREDALTAADLTSALSAITDSSE